MHLKYFINHAVWSGHISQFWTIEVITGMKQLVMTLLHESCRSNSRENLWWRVLWTGVIKYLIIHLQLDSLQDNHFSASPLLFKCSLEPGVFPWWPPWRPGAQTHDNKVIVCYKKEIFYSSLSFVSMRYSCKKSCFKLPISSRPLSVWRQSVSWCEHNSESMALKYFSMLSAYLDKRIWFITCPSDSPHSGDS